MTFVIFYHFTLKATIKQGNDKKLIISYYYIPVVTTILLIEISNTRATNTNNFSEVERLFVSINN